jgi:hypothetical protein
MCGISETSHLEDYRQAMARKRAPGDVDSYRYLGTHINSGDGTTDQNQQKSRDDAPPLKVIMAKTKVPPPSNNKNNISSEPSAFKQYPMPLSISAPRKTSFDERSEAAVRVPTPKNNHAHDYIGGGSIPTLLDRSFPHDLSSPPAKPSRPPLSPKPKQSNPTQAIETMALSEPRPPQRGQQWVSFTEQSLGDISGTGGEGYQGPDSTAAVKSGKGNTFFGTQESSASLMSGSSKSTVRVSNRTKIKKILNESPVKAAAAAAASKPWRTHSNDIDITSLIPPSRSKSTPPESQHQKDSIDDGSPEDITPVPLQYSRSVGDVFTEGLEQDREQSSVPNEPRVACLTRKFVPPAQLYHSTSGLSGVKLSLENCQTPSVSSFASSATSSQFNPSLDAATDIATILDASESGSTINSTCAGFIPSVMLDEGNPEEDLTEEDKHRRTKKGSIRLFWLFVGVAMIGLAIALAISLGSSNSSGSKFEVGYTVAPTFAPTSNVGSGEMDEGMPDLPVSDPSKPIDPDFGPVFEDTDSGYRVQEVAVEGASESERLGHSVAMGSRRIAMMGDGFVRVMELVEIPSATAILSWPRPPSASTKKRYSEKLATVGDDIVVAVTYEKPQMAMSANGERIAIVVDTRLFVYEYVDKEWKRIFFGRISDGQYSSESHAFSNAKHSIPTSVSLSDDGKMVIAGVIMPRTEEAGNVLVVNVFKLDETNEKSVEFVKPLDIEEASSHDRLYLHLSDDGRYLAVCAKDVALIGETNLMKLESIDVSGKPLEACALSGDGSTLAISAEGADETVLFSTEFEWDGYTTVPTTGIALSVDFTGDIVAIGGRSGVDLWLKSEVDGASFQQKITIPPQAEGNSAATSVAVALSKRNERGNEQFFVLARNGTVEIYEVVNSDD